LLLREWRRGPILRHLLLASVLPYGQLAYYAVGKQAEVACAKQEMGQDEAQELVGNGQDLSFPFRCGRTPARGRKHLIMQADEAMGGDEKVISLMPSVSLTCLFNRPEATKAMTCRSRWLSRA
jgi:hypothetical protein